MKIAISATGRNLESNIDTRFGRCPYFLILNLDEKKIKKVEVISNTAAEQAGGAGIAAAKIVADQGVEAVITKNIGPRALDVFRQLKIKVYQGKEGIKESIEGLNEEELEEITKPTGPQHMGISD